MSTCLPIEKGFFGFVKIFCICLCIGSVAQLIKASGVVLKVVSSIPDLSNFLIIIFKKEGEGFNRVCVCVWGENWAC